MHPKLQEIKGHLEVALAICKETGFTPLASILCVTLGALTSGDPAEHDELMLVCAEYARQATQRAKGSGPFTPAEAAKIAAGIEAEAHPRSIVYSPEHRGANRLPSSMGVGHQDQEDARELADHIATGEEPWF